MRNQIKKATILDEEKEKQNHPYIFSFEKRVGLDSIEFHGKRNSISPDLEKPSK
jgi:hypothetical protein